MNNGAVTFYVIYITPRRGAKNKHQNRASPPCYFNLNDLRYGFIFYLLFIIYYILFLAITHHYQFDWAIAD